jgi:hypothetical protein
MAGPVIFIASIFPFATLGDGGQLSAETVLFDQRRAKSLYFKREFAFEPGVSTSDLRKSLVGEGRGRRIGNWSRVVGQLRSNDLARTKDHPPGVLEITVFERKSRSVRVEKHSPDHDVWIAIAVRFSAGGAFGREEAAAAEAVRERDERRMRHCRLHAPM